LEEEVQIALQNQGLAVGYKTNIKVRFSDREFKRFHVKGTEFDGYYEKLKLVLMFDGVHHRKPRQELRDHRINQVLEKRGLTVLRFPYVSFSKGLIKKIIVKIEHVLQKKGYYGLVI